MFADAFCGEDDALGGCELAEARDQKFAADDGGGDPGGNRVHRDEAAEGRCHENLVRKGVHQLSEVGDELVAAGEIAVCVIGETGQGEEEEAGGSGEVPVGFKHHGEQGGDAESGDGELIGKIHEARAPGGPGQRGHFQKPIAVFALCR